MRQVEVEEGLRVRFPNRSEDFTDGVEIGIAAALMARGGGEFSRSVASANIEQARALAERLGYHLQQGACEGGRTNVVFRPGQSRTKLSLVHSLADGCLPVQAPPVRRSAPALFLASAIGAPKRAERVQLGQIS